MYALTSLNAASLTRGNRVLVAENPNSLGSDASQDRVMIVASVHRLNERVLITFMGNVIVGAGVNQKARIVL